MNKFDFKKNKNNRNMAKEKKVKYIVDNIDFSCKRKINKSDVYIKIEGLKR